MRVSRTICCAVALLGFMLAPYEVDAAEPNVCSVQARGSTVMIVVCAPGLNTHAWREAGEKACAGLMLCNAWIWDDARKAPMEAPSTDAELSKDHAANAVAVWISDSERMVLIRRTGK